MPFLLVDQRERILVEKPTSWRMEESAEQRNAASRFFDFLGEHLQSLGFKSTLLLPSLFRHTERKLMVCSHVDDLVLCGEKEDLEWLVMELRKGSLCKVVKSCPVLAKIPMNQSDSLRKVTFSPRRGLLSVRTSDTLRTS